MFLHYLIEVDDDDDTLRMRSFCFLFIVGNWEASMKRDYSASSRVARLVFSWIKLAPFLLK